MPVVEATVITLEPETREVEIFSILLGEWMPSLNLENANEWLEFVESLKSKAYVLPTYNVKSGVKVKPPPVSIKNLNPFDTVLVVSCGDEVPCLTRIFDGCKVSPITVTSEIFGPDAVILIISKEETKVPSS